MPAKATATARADAMEFMPGAPALLPSGSISPTRHHSPGRCKGLCGSEHTRFRRAPRSTRYRPRAGTREGLRTAGQRLDLDPHGVIDHALGRDHAELER